MTEPRKDSRETETSAEFRQALGKAFDLLSRRQHSAAQLRAKLSRHFDSLLIEQVEDRLAALGYLNDRSFAREYASQRFRRSPRSALATATELTGKGVDRETARQAVSFVMEQEGLDEESLALAAAGKKMAALAGLEPEKAREKLFRFLSARGFGGEIIYRVTAKLVRGS
ncbi:MAG: regulatory protein RecX [Candidatus Glassbacteria bacterium]